MPRRKAKDRRIEWHSWGPKGKRRIYEDVNLGYNFTTRITPMHDRAWELKIGIWVGGGKLVVIRLIRATLDSAKSTAESFLDSVRPREDE